MDNEEMYDLLRNWGISDESINKFIGQEITVDLLPSVDDYILKQLNLSLGEQIKFRNNLKNLVSNTNLEESSAKKQSHQRDFSASSLSLAPTELISTSFVDEINTPLNDTRRAFKKIQFW
ncbi:uncharacterized protein LOC141535360 [Cotesia typhae]|uniref:uncharacterized protein LOC141529982 n=1 Tax=Cotesia typhae TaxID=2053667 RepID=UPI003D681F3C